ncbi:MAG: DUF3810 family protein [Saprospiraceae bacterium]|nr:DUF3810 family protein [Saprospiraceae bacterium]
MPKDQFFFNTILRQSGKNRSFLLVLLISCIFFFLPPEWMEGLYGKLIFPLVRILLHLISWIPFPLIYIPIAAVPGWFYYLLKSRLSWKVLVLKQLKAVFAIIILFYWLWAFNYRRTDFETRFEVSVPKLDSSTLVRELNYAADLMKTQRNSDPQRFNPVQIEELVRPAVKTICQRFGYTTPGKIRVKALYPKGALLRIKTAGFYFPHAGEAYVDGGLHPLQMAFTIAHEMSHGFGVTDEGACNFLAFLATQASKDSSIQYSGAIGYFRYVAGAYRYYFPEAYQAFRDELPATIQMDLDEINQAMRRYPDLFPKLRDQIYDNYLKLQGIKEGMSSYDNIIDLVRQAREQGLL